LNVAKRKEKMNKKKKRERERERERKRAKEKKRRKKNPSKRVYVRFKAAWLRALKRLADWDIHHLVLFHLLKKHSS
jgi:hypothetical protein